MGRDKQPATIMTERDYAEDVNLESDIAYASLPKEILAWQLDYNQQAQDEITGKWVQTVSFRTKKPLRVFRSRPEIENPSTDIIAGEKFDEAMALLDTVKQKNSMLMWFAIIALFILVIISIIVLTNL